MYFFKLYENDKEERRSEIKVLKSRSIVADVKVQHNNIK